MNVLVINGSPKGDNSITLQTLLYIEKHNPDVRFTRLNAASRIRSLEKNFSAAAEQIREADLLIFSYPVYTFLVPGQLARFIELLKASGIDLSGKWATQVTTSKHFYDVTAHKYIQENAQDLGLNFVKGLSADMDDLTTEKGQQEALRFFRYVRFCMDKGLAESFPAPLPVPAHRPVSMPQAGQAIPAGAGSAVIVADLAPKDRQLKTMIERFRAVVPMNTRLVNIHDFPFSGGCISCFHCSSSGICIHKDGFDTFLREHIQTADAIVLAFSIRDHSMGALFKTYDDRQFCNGHRTVTMGTPFGYLISGDYSRQENLRLVIEGRAEVGGNFLAGTATDEFDPDSEIDRLAARLAYAAERHYAQPSNFLGVGGMKIFRDLIWLMQGMMKADHRFYKAHGQYDFPQKKWSTMLAMYLVGALLGNQKLLSKMGNKMNEGMLAPYKKVLKEK